MVTCSHFMVRHILILIGSLALAEKQPQKMKELIDKIFTNTSTTEDIIVKTLFLYFFELMGIQEKESLEYMCKFIARNTEEKKLHSLFDDDAFEISFEKLVFFQ